MTGQEQGRAIEINGRLVTVVDFFPREQTTAAWLRDMPKHLEQLHIWAREALPPGTVYEIRGRIPGDYGRTQGVAWYHEPEMADWEVTGPIPWPGEKTPLGGYMRLGTFRTP